jgi:hypothetical protein
MFGWRSLTHSSPGCITALLNSLLALLNNTMMQRLEATILITTRRAALTNARVNLRVTTSPIRLNSSAANKHGPQDVKPFVRKAPRDWAAPMVTYEEVKKRTMDPPPPPAVRSPTRGNSLI